MKPRFILVTSMTLGLFFSSTALGQPAPVQPDPSQPGLSQPTSVSRRVEPLIVKIEETKPAAEEGLSFVTDLYLDFGGDGSLRDIPESEVRQLELGTPILHLMIRLDDLKGYQSGDAIGTVITQLAKVTYPVQAPSGVVGQVVVTQEDDIWGMASAGDFKTISNIVAARARSQELTGASEDKHVLVQISALNRRYVVAQAASGEVMMTLVNRAATYPTDPEPAASVLEMLAVRAQGISNLPH